MKTLHCVSKRIFSIFSEVNQWIVKIHQVLWLIEMEILCVVNRNEYDFGEAL